MADGSYVEPDARASRTFGLDRNISHPFGNAQRRLFHHRSSRKKIGFKRYPVQYLPVYPYTPAALADAASSCTTSAVRMSLVPSTASHGLPMSAGSFVQRWQGAPAAGPETAFPQQNIKTLLCTEFGRPSCRPTPFTTHSRIGCWNRGKIGRSIVMLYEKPYPARMLLQLLESKIT